MKNNSAKGKDCDVCNMAKIKGSQILPCFQTNKLACPNFIDTSRRHSSPGSVKGLYCSCHGSLRWALSSHCFPCHCQAPQVLGIAAEIAEMNPSRCCTHNGFVSEMRNTHVLGNSLLFIRHYKANLLNLCLRGDIVFIRMSRNKSSPFPGGRHYLYLPRLFAVQMSLKTVWSKSWY